MNENKTKKEETEFSRKVKAEAKLLSINVKKLSNKIGFSQATMYRMLEGEADDLTAKELAAIAAGLDKMPEYFLKTDKPAATSLCQIEKIAAQTDIPEESKPVSAQLLNIIRHQNAQIDRHLDIIAKLSVALNAQLQTPIPETTLTEPATEENSRSKPLSIHKKSTPHNHPA